MHCIILAAGAGSRLGSLGRITPKALIPLGQGCVLDHVVTSCWVPGIDCITIVHSDLNLTDGKSTANLFKHWKKGLAGWLPEPGRKREPPYIRLINTRFFDESQLRGAVSDLSYAISKINPDGPFVVVCCDDIFPILRLDDLRGAELSPSKRGKSSALTVISTNILHPTVIDCAPSEVEISAGEVDKIGYLDSRTPWRFCGPMFFSSDATSFIHEYSNTLHALGQKADGLHDLFEAMVDDGFSVRAVKSTDSFLTINNQFSYDYALKVFGGPVAKVRSNKRQVGVKPLGDSSIEVPGEYQNLIPNVGLTKDQRRKRQKDEKKRFKEKKRSGGKTKR